MAKKYEVLEHFLDSLIQPENCIDTYGKTYLDEIDLIARENHGFDEKTQKFADAAMQTGFDRVRKQYGFKTLTELAEFVKSHVGEVSVANYRPRTAIQYELMFEEEPVFLELKEKGDAVALSNEFQKKWSERGHSDHPEASTDRDYYELYVSYDRMNPWTFLLRRELERGNLSPDDKVLCIGNRWNGEILYFRETLGLKKTMGVDLISNNPELVVAADMHKMPFEDSSIKMIYCRGTLNKSYDIRVFIKEMLRVLKKDGFLVLETPGPFGDGVNNLSRTDLKNSDNLLRLLNGQVRRIVYKDDTTLIHSEGNVKTALRLFVQVDKGAKRPLPKPEPFPFLRFKAFDTYRHYLTRTRRKFKRMLSSANESRTSSP